MVTTRHQASAPRPPVINAEDTQSATHVETETRGERWARARNARIEVERARRKQDEGNVLPPQHCLQFMLEMTVRTEPRIHMEKMKTIWAVISEQKLEHFYDSSREVSREIWEEYLRWEDPTNLLADHLPSLVLKRKASQKENAHRPDPPAEPDTSASRKRRRQDDVGTDGAKTMTTSRTMKSPKGSGTSTAPTQRKKAKR